MKTPNLPVSTSAGSNEDIIDLQRYWYILRRRYWTLITTFIIVVVSVVIYTFHQIPVYQATTTLILEPDFPQVLEFRDVTNTAPFKEFYQTQMEIIKSRKVVDLTLEVLQQSNRKKKKDTGDLVPAFQERIKIESQKDTRLLKVSMRNEDPEEAAREVNTLARMFIMHNLEDRREASRDAFVWLSEKLVILEEQVKKSEAALLKYKEEEDILSLEKRQVLLEERIAETNESYNTAVQKSIELNTQLQEIEKLRQNEMIEALPRILDHSMIQDLKKEYNALELQMAKASKKYKSKHPVILGLQSQIDHIRKRMMAEVNKLIRSIETEARISQANEDMILASLDQLKQESMQLAQQAIQYGVLKREAESNQAMYDVLLLRLKETDISGSTNANNIRIVDEAVVPVDPVSPKKWQNLILAAMLGLALGLGFCFGAEYFDNTVAVEEDVKIHLHETLLGLVPKKKGMIETWKIEMDGISRSYREIKTTLNFYGQEHVMKSLLITSATEKEGKTTTVYWLGVAFAQSGFNVLLLDADMFKPRLHKLFNVSNSIGLSNYFLYQKNPDELILPTELPNLSIIPAGLIPPNPAEILGSQKMKELIIHLRNRFDLIIIDSPPVSGALEVAALGNASDGIAFVIKANHQPWQVIKKSLSTIKSMKGNVLGTILTSVRHGEGSSYYYSYHRETAT